MAYIEQPVSKYLADLSAKLPAPGGGSASALAAATGTALLAMAANFTLGKKGYEACQDEINGLLARLDAGQKKLSALIDLDVEAYSKISAVYKLSGNTEEEKKQRGAAIQSALKEAMAVPRDILFTCADMIAVSKTLVDIANKNLISDVGCGALMLESAMRCAKLNVEINLVSIKDADFVAAENARIVPVLGEAGAAVKEVLEKTGKGMK